MMNAFKSSYRLQPRMPRSASRSANLHLLISHLRTRRITASFPKRETQAQPVQDRKPNWRSYTATANISCFCSTPSLPVKNVVISGATGSAKTTLAKALIKYIPHHERVISIEDTPELVIPQPNHVRLFYSKGGQGLSGVGPRELLESCLRMRPDRILLQELRDGTAFYYIRNVNSGHPGSITTVHAGSTQLAFEQLATLVKESEAGRALERAEVLSSLKVAIDIVVQCRRIDGYFRATEIYFRDGMDARIS